MAIGFAVHYAFVLLLAGLVETALPAPTFRPALFGLGMALTGWLATSPMLLVLRYGLTGLVAAGQAPGLAGGAAAGAGRRLSCHPIPKEPLMALLTIRPWADAANRLVAGLTRLQALAQGLARVYVAKVFFLSGLTKLRDWDSTLALFSDEYHVPLLPPGLAAWMGTGGELVLPVLLLLGLGGRFAALGLGVVNLMAVLSLSDLPEPALNQHLFWGSLLLGLLLWGPGRLSVDALIGRWLQRRTA